MMRITRADAERLLAQQANQRSVVVQQYLLTVRQLGQLIDRLGELHADLAEDDRLHQVLHALTFVWENVEEELAIVGSGKN